MVKKNHEDFERQSYSRREGVTEGKMADYGEPISDKERVRGIYIVCTIMTHMTNYLRMFAVVSSLKLCTPKAKMCFNLPILSNFNFDDQKMLYFRFLKRQQSQ